MKPQIACAVFSLCFAGLMQAAMETPKVGTVRYSSGDVRAVYGLQSNFIIGHESIARASAASFSDKFGLIASQGAIQLLDGAGAVIDEFESGEPHPILSVGNTSTSAVAWLPSSQQIIHWNRKRFALTELSSQLPGTVLSIESIDANSITMLTTSASGELYEALVSLETGAVTHVNPVGKSQGLAFAANGFLLFRGEAGWILRTPEGASKPVAVSSPDLAVEKMSSDTLHLISAGTIDGWVLRLTRAGGELAQLPAAPATQPLVSGGIQ